MLTYTLYNFICLSSEAVSRSSESGENVNDLMGIACPSRVWTSLLVATS